MKNIAIITARGGSKRIPKKNIKDFLGKPIISYGIDAALESGLFDEVMVSTDDKAIAEVALRCGAQVPFLRSAGASDDFATTSDVLCEVIDRYARDGARFDSVCCIYPTAPFVTAEKLRRGMDILETRDVDSVVPVVPFSYPPQRGYVMSDGLIALAHPEYENARSQDLDTIYHDCGQFYCLKTTAFLKTKKITSGRIAPLVMSDLEVQDIDTLEDWAIAEMKYEKMVSIWAG